MVAGRPDWLLIDGSSLIFRGFYGVPKTTVAPTGELINAVVGLVDTMTRLIGGRKPRRLAVAADADWRPAWRVELIPSYKAHRVAEPVPPELIPQMAWIEELLAATGIAFVGVPDLEAEDVIASWVEQLDGRIEILSGDRDLFALVRDPDVVVLYPEKGRLSEVDEAEVTKRYDIPGRRYGDFAALRGDPSDGLPGLVGVGARTAAQMIRKYGSLEGLLAEGSLSDAQRDYVERAMRVVKPGSPEPVPVPAGCRASWPADADALSHMAARFGIEGNVERLLAVVRRHLPEQSLGSA